MKATILPPSEVTFFSYHGAECFFFQIYSQPVPGYFGADQTLDFMLQAQTGDGNKKVKEVKAGRAVAAQEWGRLGKKRQTFSGARFPHLFGWHSLLWPQAWKGKAQAMPWQGL